MDIVDSKQHVVQGGDGLQGHGHNGRDFEGLETEPHVAIAPYGDVILLRLVRVPGQRPDFHGFPLDFL